MAFLMENGVTILLSVIVAVLVIGAIRFILRHRHSCGNCTGCPYAGHCDKQDG